MFRKLSWPLPASRRPPMHYLQHQPLRKVPHRNRNFWTAGGAGGGGAILLGAFPAGGLNSDPLWGYNHDGRALVQCANMEGDW